MSIDHSIPPLDELRPGLLEERKEHLLAEITGESKTRLPVHTFAVPRRRLLALVATSLCGVVAAVVTISLMGGGGSGASRPLFLMQALRGPAWSVSTGDVNFGGLSAACRNSGELLFGCTGVFPASSAPEMQPLAASSTEASDTVIVGGTDSQRTLLQSIVDAMQPNAIDKITIVPASGAVTLQMDGRDSSMLTLWQESIVAGAFRDRVTAEGNDTVVSLDNVESNGVIAPGPATSLPSAEGSDAERARRVFQAAATKSGADLDELTISQPDGIAVSATLHTNEAAAFLVNQMPTFLAAIGDRWHDYDGVYIRLVDESGGTAWETSTVGRTSTGSVGTRQDLAGCSPIIDWGPSSGPCSAR